jgi:hypothetical protein
MDPQQEQRSLLEENLVKVLSAIDTQIAREMQRTPAQREEHGVQKWEPYQKRVELIVSRVLNSLGDQEVTLDGVLVFAQAMSKTLLLAVEDLGADGLGKIRSSYCEAAMQNIAQDVSRGLQMLRQGGELN